MIDIKKKKINQEDYVNVTVKYLKNKSHWKDYEKICELAKSSNRTRADIARTLINNGLKEAKIL